MPVSDMIQRLSRYEIVLIQGIAWDLPEFWAKEACIRFYFASHVNNEI